ncbi:MAG: glycoside hydrolase family 3 N-terminal domain-containing protein, partial [Pseudomonadota bacterium]
ARYSPEQAAVRYRKAADDLARLGVNLNFGPVVDLNRNRRNPIIARKRRAYGATTADVLPYAHAFISAHRAAGVLTSAKHFPGHGSSWADSHRRFVDLTKTWDAVELAPYRALTGAAAPDMVMVGHLYHPRFSPRGERVPASLSPAAIRGVLRGKIGYRGIVITDDLEMAAVTRRYSLKERVIRAIAAGNDVIMLSDGTTRGTGVVDAIHRHVREAVLSGRIGLAQIRAAHARIIATKARLAGTRREARAD